MPSGINQILFFNLPGNEIIKIEKSANKVSALQPVPTQTPGLLTPPTIPIS